MDVADETRRWEWIVIRDLMARPSCGFPRFSTKSLRQSLHVRLIFIVKSKMRTGSLARLEGSQIQDEKQQGDINWN